MGKFGSMNNIKGQINVIQSTPLLGYTFHITGVDCIIEITCLYIEKCDDFIAGGSLHFFLPNGHHSEIELHKIDSSRQRIASVAQLCLVTVLPNLGQNHRGVKSEENAQRKCHFLNDGPRVKSEKLLLNRTLLHFGHFKGEQDPHGQVTQQ